MQGRIDTGPGFIRILSLFVSRGISSVGRALAWHARGQGFKSHIRHCGTAAIEQESGESSEESRTSPARSPAVYSLLSTLKKSHCGKAAIGQESGESSEERRTSRPLYRPSRPPHLNSELDSGWPPESPHGHGLY